MARTTPFTPGPRLCPTCGTRVGPAATKCLVCGSDLSTGTQPVPAARPTQPGKKPPTQAGGLSLPQISLPLPAALAAVGVFIIVGFFLIFGALGSALGLGRETPTLPPSPTAAATFTPRPTDTETPAPTPTPLPPLDYTVQAGDTLGLIALTHNVTVQSIADLNGISLDTPLQIGQILKIPQPTPTPTPEPSATPDTLQLTVIARPTYVVRQGDTLGGICRFYNVDCNYLMAINNIARPETIFPGQVLSIPIDRRLPTAGPTPTETPPPPYAAPQLLSPADGAAFTAADQSVTLQWTTVDILRENEVYFITVVDVTCSCARELKVTTASNRLIIPADMRPTEAVPHVFKWTVVTARQVGTDSRGQPIYEPAGATSEARTFTWYGAGAPAATPSSTPG